MSRTPFVKELRQLAGNALIYGLGSILLRALSLLLLPLYTRYLTPADYGIAGAASSIIAVLAICLPLGLHGSITRLWFEAGDDEGRRQIVGTIFLLLVGCALAMTVLVDLFGKPLFAALFPDLPFQPYLRIAVWTAFCQIVHVVPLAVFQVRERPAIYVMTSVSAAVMSVAVTVWLVVFERKGAYGYLLGSLIGAAVAIVPYLWLLRKEMRFVLRPAIAVAALTFSLPLVPHGLASWVLDLSDRVVLAHYVSLQQLGLYSLGYQLGAILGLAVMAFGSAWAPFLYRTLRAEGEASHQRLTRLITYYVCVLAFLALGVSLFAHSMLVLLTPASFHPAHVVSPWVAAGYVFNGLYIVPATFLFWKSRTGLIPVITISAGSVNVALNLLLVPRHGIVAAAAATTVSYALMLLVAWLLARKVYPFRYEYSRIGAVLGVATLLFGAGMLIRPASMAGEMVVRAVLILAFPFLLLTGGFVGTSERRRLLDMISFRSRADVPEGR